jgi:hypothetical protein
VLTPNGTGNQYWRFGVDWGGIKKQLTNTLGSDITVTPGTKYLLNTNCTTSGALLYNVSSTSNRYIFKTLNAGTDPTGSWTFFDLSSSPITVSNVTRNLTSVGAGQPVTVTVTLSGSLPTGQGAYIRYTTDNYATSTIEALTGSGTSYTATIPSATNASGANVSYYIFTSGSGLTIANADADLYTINLIISPRDYHYPFFIHFSICHSFLNMSLISR